MDIRHASQFFQISQAAVTALALAVSSYESAVAADSTADLTVVTASDDGVDLQQPSAIGAGGSGLVILTDDADDAAAATPSTVTPRVSAQGTLSVVANGRNRPAVAAVVSDSEVVPAAHRRGPVFTGEGRRNAVAGAPLRQDSRHRSPSGSANRRIEQNPSGATLQRVAAPSRAQQAAERLQAATHVPRKSADPAEAFLIQAYEISVSAQSEAEYSHVIRLCAEAMRGDLHGENRQFGMQLSAWALNRRGEARIEQNQLNLALADFRAAIEFDPQCWRAYHNRGVSLAQTGQFAEAFDDVCRVILINPKFAKAYSNRATLYVQASDLERAIADYEEALRLDPNLTPALVGYGRLCHLTGRLDDALANFTHAMQHAGVTAEVACSRGDLLADMGRYREALQDYAQAIDVDPKFQHAYRNGAWLLATCPDESVRDAQGAILGAQKALECGYGERHAALDTLAAALANAGQYQEAVAAIDQALEIAPETAQSDYQQRRELYEAGQPYRTEPISDVQTADFVEG